MTNKLELHIIELPKIKGKEKIESELLDWLFFLENPKSERVEEKMNDNEELKEAVTKVNRMSEDEYMQRIADLREKAIIDERSMISYATNQGIQQGERKEKLETAKKMLEEGIDLEVIQRVTGLTKEEIMELK